MSKNFAIKTAFGFAIILAASLSFTLWDYGPYLDFEYFEIELLFDFSVTIIVLAGAYLLAESHFRWMKTISVVFLLLLIPVFYLSEIASIGLGGTYALSALALIHFGVSRMRKALVGVGIVFTGSLLTYLSGELYISE